MLLTNRRHRILFIALAGMEVAWFLPLALTFFVWLHPNETPLPALLAGFGGYSPLAVFGVCWGVLLFYLLCADLLNRWRIDSPLHEATMIGTVAVTALLLVRLLIYPTLAPWNFWWLAAVVRAIFDFVPEGSAIIFLLVVNLFLWIRVASATDRDLTFFSVGVSFRLGMLLALFGNTLLILVAGRAVETALTYFWLFFAFGLLAVAVARIDEKAIGAAQSTGAALPWQRFGQLLLMIGTTLVVAIEGAAFYTPVNIRTVLGWFSPLWNFLGTIVLWIFYTLFWLLVPLLERLIEFVRSLINNLEPAQPFEQNAPLAAAPPDPMTLSEMVQAFAIVRYCLVTGVIVAIVLLLLILFVRIRQRGVDEEMEQAAQEGLALGGNPFNRLRNLGRLLRRYGLGPGLLAAISVQNIYANVSRLAGRRGQPRTAALSPDEYLPRLQIAFPDEREKLVRLTAAYMRVHYGDQPVEQAELLQLREDYQALQATPPEQRQQISRRSSNKSV